MKRIRLLTLAIAIAGLVLGSSAGFNASDAQAQGQSGGRSDVLIAFDRTPGPAEQALVRGVGGEIKHTFTLVPAIAASLPDGAIQGLRSNPRVTAIDLDGEVHALDHPTGDDELDNGWGVAHIGSGAVHAGGNNGVGVKVAIIDSGIDYTHPDLDANFAGGYDFVNDDADPMDDNGHGTHVAGTVGALDNGPGVVGVAPAASLYGLKVLNSSGSGSWSDIIAALQWAVDNGIQVTNNSYGSSTNPGGTVEAAFDNSATAGVLHVAAAGNSGNPKGKGNNVGYPARFDSVIAVAATDSNDNRARFSSTGDTVELAAPGVSINSTLLGGGYGTKSGTSMASPHVAGTAALVIAAGNNDAAAVRGLLQTTADDLGDPGRDKLYGYGLVDADEAAVSVGPPNDAPAVFITSPADSATFNSGDTITFAGSAGDTEDGDLTANLVWMSDIDGQIGTSGSFSTTLSDGVHVITPAVTDSGGKVGSASVSITVTPPPNDAPAVFITSPDEGFTFDSGATILFEGTASDAEDDDATLTDAIDWTSDINGPIGTGGSFSTTLSDGVHTITASVTDSGAKTGSASISITVGNPPAEATTVSVASIEYTTSGGKNGDKHLHITVALVDDLGYPVANASVSIDLFRDDNLVGSGSGTTGEGGSVTFTLKNHPSGHYMSSGSVTAAGLTWDNIWPDPGYDKL